MTRIVAFAIILGFTMNSCDGPVEQSVEGDYSGLLSTEEIEGGILTPEILWKFGRLGDMQLSPDGRYARV